MRPFVRSISLTLAGSTLLFQPAAKADVTYKETTQINGGSLTDLLKLAGAFSSQAKQLGGPIVYSVMIHDQRMVKVSPLMTQIIDLDQRTITNIDNQKHTYSTVTFEQMKQAMAKATARATQTSQPSTDPADQLQFSGHVSRSGATKEIDGKTAKEALLTVTVTSSASDSSNAKGNMAATSEMWMVDSAPGMDEMLAFRKRLSVELGVETGGSGITNMLASKPGAAQALADLQKQAAALTGIPVLQITRVGISADGQPLPAPSVVPLPAQAKSDGVPVGGIAKDAAPGAGTITANDQLGRLGTFGRLLGGSTMGAISKHKPAPKAAPADDHAAANAAVAGILLEAQSQLEGFSTTPVSTTAFAIPSGYKKIDSPMSR